MMDGSLHNNKHHTTEFNYRFIDLVIETHCMFVNPEEIDVYFYYNAMGTFLLGTIYYSKINMV